MSTLDASLIHPQSSADSQPQGRVHLLPNPQLQHLNTRSDLKGGIQLLSHGLVILVSGSLWIWGLSQGSWSWVLPALMIYGISLATLFAPVHECVHRTAFASRWLNDGVAWIAGLLSFYNSSFFRYYHRWHHRYAQIPGKDPELTDPKPQTLGQYFLEIGGWYWWIGRLQFFSHVALGQIERYPFIPNSGKAQVIRSVRIQVLLYGFAIAISVALGYPWIVVLWLLPMIWGQPVLRFILLAEHTGCSTDDNVLTNTRTTLAIWPIRLLMWNMPFHAEHHLYPSIPFHALPTAHQELRSHWTQMAPGYLQANRQIIAGLGDPDPVQ